jgi:hypothetical protein
MIRLYVFLLDFLIPFLCDPDLQCTDGPASARAASTGAVNDGPESFFSYASVTPSDDGG